MPVVTSGSKKFNVNFQSTPTGGAEWLLEFFACLTAAGWVAVDFSNGSSVTTSATPATIGQISNNNAWQRWRAPAGTFEMWFQRSTTDYSWRAFYDVDGFNNDGTPTVGPTAVSTAVCFIGQNSSGGFDASFAGLTGQADLKRWHFCVDSVAGVAGFYHFHGVAIVTGTGVASKRFCFTPLEPGTYAPEDIVPACSVEASISGQWNENIDWETWFKKGLAGEALVSAARPDGWSTFSSQGVVNPYNNKHSFVRGYIEDRVGADANIKGATLDVFFPASNKSALAENDTLNLTTAWTSSPAGDPGALIRFDDVLLPWPDTVTPLI